MITCGDKLKTLRNIGSKIFLVAPRPLGNCRWIKHMLNQSSNDCISQFHKTISQHFILVIVFFNVLLQSAVFMYLVLSEIDQGISNTMTRLLRFLWLVRLHSRLKAVMAYYIPLLASKRPIFNNNILKKVNLICISSSPYLLCYEYCIVSGLIFEFFDFNVYIDV